MDFKKKTIIWEDNNEPPKDYIWAKKDGKFYEYNYATRSWIESKLIKAEKSGGNSDNKDSEGGNETDLNEFLTIMQQLESDGYYFGTESIVPIAEYNEFKDVIPSEGTVYGSPENAFAVVLFFKNDEHVKLGFLTKEEYDALAKMIFWNFDRYWKDDTAIAPIDPMGPSLQDTILLSTQLPMMYANYEEYPAEQLDPSLVVWGAIIGRTENMGMGQVEDILTVISNDYDISIISNSFNAQDVCAIKIYNDDEAYYMPVTIGVRGPYE